MVRSRSHTLWDGSAGNLCLGALAQPPEGCWSWRMSWSHCQSRQDSLLSCNGQEPEPTTPWNGSAGKLCLGALAPLAERMLVIKFCFLLPSSGKPIIFHSLSLSLLLCLSCSISLSTSLFFSHLQSLSLTLSLFVEYLPKLIYISVCMSSLSQAKSL